MKKALSFGSGLPVISRLTAGGRGAMRPRAEARQQHVELRLPMSQQELEEMSIRSVGHSELEGLESGNVANRQDQAHDPKATPTVEDSSPWESIQERLASVRMSNTIISQHLANVQQEQEVDRE